MANPTKLAWSAPTQNVDGTPFTAEQYAGFEVELRGPAGLSSVVLPSAWSPNGEYEFPLADLSVGFGATDVRMRTLAVGGLVSDWTNAITIRIAAPPLPPRNLRAE